MVFEYSMRAAPEFKGDLARISGFLFEVSRDMRVVEQALDSIDDAILGLLGSPRFDVRPNSPALAAAGVFKKTVRKRYTVYYTVDQDIRCVNIIYAGFVAEDPARVERSVWNRI